jgi:triacylglycerol esterase/lipase EstA (alpha/beta hydrolase family)
MTASRRVAVAAAVVLAGVALGSSGAGAYPARAGAVAGCTPSARHPYPVVLVPGTLIVTTWNVVGPALVRQGYCVYRFNYGNYGTAEIGGSARKLASYVDAVLARTHAKKVSIVGHSQGGMMPRYYVRFLGGARKVDDLIGLAPSNHGTLNPMIAATGVPCEACTEQAAGSAFLKKLNRGSETPGPVDYTVVETVDDLVLVPYTSAFLDGPRSRVTNITLQNACPYDFVTHLGIPSDPVALQWIENALGRKGPADPSFTPAC